MRKKLSFQISFKRRINTREPLKIKKREQILTKENILFPLKIVSRHIGDKVNV